MINLELYLFTYLKTYNIKSFNFKNYLIKIFIITNIKFNNN